MNCLEPVYMIIHFAARIFESRPFQLFLIKHSSIFGAEYYNRKKQKILEEKKLFNNLVEFLFATS